MTVMLSIVNGALLGIVLCGLVLLIDAAHEWRLALRRERLLIELLQDISASDDPVVVAANERHGPRIKDELRAQHRYLRLPLVRRVLTTPPRLTENWR